MSTCLRKGVVSRETLANGNITRYQLANGWFIDHGQGPHKGLLGPYEVWEPGGSKPSALTGARCAARRGGAKTLTQAITLAFRLNPANTPKVRP